jgi:hypothetical protein
MQPPIGDYGLVGDCHGAALVSRAGSIDWLCWPRFDSAWLFGALLDRDGGCWSIAPVGLISSRRRYLGESNVLETRMVADGGGEVVLTDLMAVASEEHKRAHLVPDHELIRRVECVRGPLELEIVFAPRPMGRPPLLQARGPLGLRLDLPSGQGRLSTAAPAATLSGARPGAPRGRPGAAFFVHAGP